jgi:60 kDa SS-A/Ro ribonucleoprotein
MSKFARPDKKSRKTENYMGAPALTYLPKDDFIALMFSSFAEDKYYETADKSIARMKELIGRIEDKKFVAKTILYAREVFGMRSMTHAAVSELAQVVRGEPWTKTFYCDVVNRVDDITEILAYTTARYPTVPNSLKKGLRAALDKFDDYQIAKYQGLGKSMNLRDAVNLLHPVPTERNERALRALVADGHVVTDGNWKAELVKASAVEDTETARHTAWADLVKSRKIGYFALLRNLRNIVQDAPDVIDDVLIMLVDERLIMKSKVFPYRYLVAYQAIEELYASNKQVSDAYLYCKPTFSFKDDQQTPTFSRAMKDRIVAAIEQAMTTATVNNLPVAEGKTLILIDNSGSMTGDSSGSSKLSRFSTAKMSDIGNLFGVLYWMRSEDAQIGLFGDRLIVPNLDRAISVFKNFDIVDRAKDECGPATETGIFTAFEAMLNDKTMVDTIVIFSDSQIGDGCDWYTLGGRDARRGDAFNELCDRYRTLNPNVRIYSVDLRGYGTTVFDDNVVKLSGFSPNLFEVMAMLDQNTDTLVELIDAYREY